MFSQEKGRSRMVSQPVPDRTRMSVQEYFELERSNPDRRYEYIDGQVYLMAGGTFNHSTVSVNIVSLLKRLLRGGPCRAYNSDIKVKVSSTRYVYPDVSVSCHPGDRGTGDMMEYPKLVVEVLSPSTQGYDRWHKSLLYYEVPTIEEIVLVDAERQLLAVHRRGQNHFWTIHVFRQGETVRLASLDLSIPIETLYEDVEFPPNGE